MLARFIPSVSNFSVMDGQKFQISNCTKEHSLLNFIENIPLRPFKDTILCRRFISYSFLPGIGMLLVRLKGPISRQQLLHIAWWINYTDKCQVKGAKSNLMGKYRLVSERSYANTYLYLPIRLDFAQLRVSCRCDFTLIRWIRMGEFVCVIYIYSGNDVNFYFSSTLEIAFLASQNDLKKI